MSEKVQLESLLATVLSYFPALLQAYWVLATSSVLVTLLPIPVPQGFKDAVRLSAARGKLWSTRPQSLGKLNDLAVPQAWFSHFYAIGSACCLTLVLLATPATPAGSSESDRLSDAEAIQFISLWLFLLHLVRRLLETCCLMVYPASARMHAIAYVFGLSYYVVAPLSLLCTAQQQAPSGSSSIQPFLGLDTTGLAEPEQWAGSVAARAAAAPGALQAALQKAFLQQEQEGPGLVLSLSVLRRSMGILVTLAGFILQLYSHRVLAGLTAQGQSRLRGSGGASDKESSTVYSIPQGGAFEWVSCPHYAAEVAIYAGLVLLTWPYAANVPLMLAWVATNLVLAAGATQRWYRAAFPASYPRDRRALIPGVF